MTSPTKMIKKTSGKVRFYSEDVLVNMSSDYLIKSSTSMGSYSYNFAHRHKIPLNNLCARADQLA